MTATDNKTIMTEIFADMAKGDAAPFVDAMAEDFAWIIAGKGKWAGTWRGKTSVRADLLRPLMAQFADRYTNTARRIHADGDFVIVECQGRVTTKANMRYDNDYCLVIRMADGKMSELTEYMDTALAEAVLTAPA